MTSVEKRKALSTREEFGIEQWMPDTIGKWLDVFKKKTKNLAHPSDYGSTACFALVVVDYQLAHLHGP